MKKLLLTGCAILGLILTINTSSFAQEGRIQIGPGLAYGTEVEKLGISVDGYYTINEKFRAGAALTYFFPESNDYPGGSVDVNYFAVDLNGNYIFHNEDQLMAYGIAGLNIFRVSVDSEVDGEFAGTYSTSSSEVGLNIGAGLEYGLDFGNLVGELTYAGLGGDVDQLVLKAGVRFDI